MVTEQLVSRINGAKLFTILTDEMTDISGIEQFSLYVRYLDILKKEISEDFLKFIPIHDVGAATMSGHFNGVYVHVIKIYPIAHYIHCCFHCLNCFGNFRCV